MKKYLIVAVAVAAALTAACGGSDQLQTAPSALAAPQHSSQDASSGVVFSTREVQCVSPTYVGPIRLPISVHGVTVQLSWLGNDDATSYELEFERYDVSNVWLPALHDTVLKPEAKEFLHTEGTYRVRVRGLFCNSGVGGFTDWTVFSTDDTEDHSHSPQPIVCLTSVVGCGPPPCLIDCGPPPPPPPVVCAPNEHLVDGNCVHNGDGDGNGNGNGDDNGNGGGNGNPPPPPPVWEDVAFCHAEFHPAKDATGKPGKPGYHPAEPAYYSYQDKVAHSQNELDQHIGIHDHDYLGACTN